METYGAGGGGRGKRRLADLERIVLSSRDTREGEQEGDREGVFSFFMMIPKEASRTEAGDWRVTSRRKEGFEVTWQTRWSPGEFPPSPSLVIVKPALGVQRRVL